MVQIRVDISTPSTREKTMVYHAIGLFLLVTAGICESKGKDSLMVLALGAMLYVLLVPITGKAARKD